VTELSPFSMTVFAIAALLFVASAGLCGFTLGAIWMARRIAKHSDFIRRAVEHMAAHGMADDEGFESGQLSTRVGATASSLTVTNEMLEAAHRLDAAVFERLLLAGGHLDMHAASAAEPTMHVLRASHPSFSRYEADVSREWLRLNQQRFGDHDDDDETAHKPKLN